MVTTSHYCCTLLGVPCQHPQRWRESQLVSQSQGSVRQLLATQRVSGSNATKSTRRRLLTCGAEAGAYCSIGLNSYIVIVTRLLYNQFSLTLSVQCLCATIAFSLSAFADVQGLYDTVYCFQY